MSELDFAQKEKLRIAERLAWYAAAEKRIKEIMANQKLKAAKQRKAAQRG